MQNQKPSSTGLMSQSHEVSRFENLFFKKIDSAYYNLKWGLDWNFFLDSSYEIPLNSFGAYLVQQAMGHGIVVTGLHLAIADFTLTMTVTVDGIEFTTTKVIEQV